MTKFFTLIALASAIFASCGGSNHYSPLDSYVDAYVRHYHDSVQFEREQRHWLDSLNNNHLKVQCSALTKSGKQCKRMIKLPSVFPYLCYQHKKR